MTVPAHVAAFASGMTATGTRNFHVIAAVISALGLGTYDQATLRLAVQDWNDQHMRTADAAQAAIVDAVDMTRGTEPS